MSQRKIRFKGREWLLVGGAITTPELFENFEPSYAHLFTEGPDAGKVMRYGEEIGKASDVEDLGPAHVEVKSMLGILDPGWEKP